MTKSLSLLGVHRRFRIKDRGGHYFPLGDFKKNEGNSRTLYFVHVSLHKHLNNKILIRETFIQIYSREPLIFREDELGRCNGKEKKYKVWGWVGCS